MLDISRVPNSVLRTAPSFPQISALRFFNIPPCMSLNVIDIGPLWPLKIYTTFNNGSLGSRIDEERSEMR